MFEKCYQDVTIKLVMMNSIYAEKKQPLAMYKDIDTQKKFRYREFPIYKRTTLRYLESSSTLYMVCVISTEH